MQGRSVPLVAHNEIVAVITYISNKMGYSNDIIFIEDID